jgi:nitroimidazol reductase NimA-like FMN-containing flavoprotein (pyridoxamine 5'-phosphate oxidase superfamily)
VTGAGPSSSGSNVRRTTPKSGDDMSLAMTTTEREAFLAEVHVGILSVDDPGRGPLTVPVWYAYEPGGTVDVITGGQSTKARRLREAARFSLCAQTETPPYRYVSVEGPIIVIEDTVSLDERRGLAHRYLGAELGDLYLVATAADAPDSIVIRMAPQRWLTTDYAKQFG